jgi:hypothetical protein
MKNGNVKIDNLKKVTLSMEAGITPDAMNLASAPFEFEFIFGLGREGLSNFECQLENKTKGDEILLQLNRNQLHKTFEYLTHRLPQFSDALDTFYLKARVLEVAPAESRKVIKAMAEASKCGENCCGDSCCHF